MASNINMEFARRVVIDTAGMDWRDSPLAGVQRRMYVKTGHLSAVRTDGPSFTDIAA